MSADDEGFEFYVDGWCDVCASTPCQCQPGRPAERLSEDGCRRLAEAVLAGAVRALGQPDGRGRREASAFFEAGDHRGWCVLAGVDPDRFKAALERHLRQPAAEAGQVKRPEASDHQDDT